MRSKSFVRHVGSVCSSPLLLLALTLVLAVIAPGCRAFESDRACGERPDLVVSVLYDLSGSVGEQRVEYKKMSFQLLDELYDPQKAPRLSYKPAFQGETLFSADLITANSVAFAQMPVRACFPAFGMLSNFEKYKKQCLQTSENARKQISEVLGRNKPPERTDILGAILNARKVLFSESAASAKSKYLVIFSDMVQETPACDLTREPLTDARIDAMLGLEMKSGRIPDLAGVRVWVAGAGGSADPRMTGERLLWIQRFWMRYFQSSHADLTDARYAGTLNDFHLPQL